MAALVALFLVVEAETAVVRRVGWRGAFRRFGRDAAP
jgi:hypothetical protein